MSGHTFVTVCHSVDVPLLRVQARSFARYMPDHLIAAIIVIANPQIGDLPVDTIHREYGRHAGKVVFIDGAQWVPPKIASGWWSQQLHKLQIAFALPPAIGHYTVLDAKHHLVHPLYNEFLINPRTGLPRIRVYGYRMEHPLRERLLTQLDYWGLPEKHVNCFLQTTPPFTFYISHVRHLIEEVCTREEELFNAAFMRLKMTEFFAYGCSILAAGHQFEELYSLDQDLAPIIWKHGADVWGCLQQIAESEEPQRPFFAVHRGAIKNLDQAAREAIAQFWARRSLFESVAAARQFLLEAAESIPQ